MMATLVGISPHKLWHDRNFRQTSSRSTLENTIQQRWSF